MGATDSTTDLYDRILDHLIAFTDGVTTVASLIGAGAAARLYPGAPPEFATWPGTYAVVRFINNDTSDFGSGDRFDFDIEIMIFARPRSKAREAEKLADLFDMALLRYTVGSAVDGLIYVTGRTRDTLPPGTGDVDREVVQLRQLFSAFTWPMYLINRP